LIGPLSRQGDGAVVLIKKREHLAATNSADLEHQEAFSQQRMKWVSYGRPSQMVLAMECSLLGVSLRYAIGLWKRRSSTYSNQYSSVTSPRTATVFGPAADAEKR
jgi:hypothetical protein